MTISRPRRFTPQPINGIFGFVQQLAQDGLLKGKTMGVDSTNLEANAAMKSIRALRTGECYMRA